jgi:hypothetical protein
LSPDFSAEPLTLLHALDKSLDTASQFLGQFVAWDVVSRIGCESATLFILRLFRLDLKHLLVPAVGRILEFQLSGHGQGLCILE